MKKYVLTALSLLLFSSAEAAKDTKRKTASTTNIEQLVFIDNGSTPKDSTPFDLLDFLSRYPKVWEPLQKLSFISGLKIDIHTIQYWYEETKDSCIYNFFVYFPREILDKLAKQNLMFTTQLVVNYTEKGRCSRYEKPASKRDNGNGDFYKFTNESMKNS
jgi:hypothetical protein